MAVTLLILAVSAAAYLNSALLITTSEFICLFVTYFVISYTRSALVCCSLADTYVSLSLAFSTIANLYN